MSKGIIQTAISKELPLELAYRKPDNSNHGTLEYCECGTEQFESAAASSFDEFKQILSML